MSKEQLSKEQLYEERLYKEQSFQKPTPSQQEAIQWRGGSLLVSAAAGSGKTTVLVQRILSLLEDEQHPASLDRILVLTFTNAAADSMKEKIEKQLMERLENRPEKAFYEEQFRLVPLSHIQTNHAFSLFIVRNYITELDHVDPGFRVADESEASLLRSDVLSQVLEEHYSSALSEDLTNDDRDFLSMVRAFSGARQDAQLEEVVLGVYTFLMSLPDPDRWLDEAVEKYNTLSWNGQDQWSLLSEQDTRETIDTLIRSLSRLTELYQILCDTSKGVKAAKAATAHKDLERFSQMLETVSAYEKRGDLEEACRYLSGICFPRMNHVYEWDTRDHEEERRELYDQVKTCTAKAGTKAGAPIPEAEKKKIQEFMYPALRGLRLVLRDFRREYEQEKNRRNLLEIDDFEQYALKILKNPSVRRQLQEQFDYIFIDEYQDCSPIQEEIIQQTARHNAAGQSINLFLVGDVKQSIYGFRRADPSLFLDKYRTYGTVPDTHKVLLNQNFRSSSPVIQAVNAVFSSLMVREVGGLEYTQEEALYPGRKGADDPSFPKPVLTVLTGDKELKAEDLQQAEAGRIADLVEDLLKKGRQPSDIVVLYRSVKGRGYVLARELASRHISAYCESTENFYDTPEIKTVICLLSIIDNPIQDIPLMGVLISPIGGFSADDLGVIRLSARGVPYFEALKAFAREGAEGPCHTRACEFLSQLEDWRKRSRYMNVPDLLWYLYRQTGYYLYASQMPGGAVRQKNLDLMLEKASSFEQGTYTGLHEFLRYLDKMDKTRTTENEARLLDNTRHMVRIMTIHKSKGLEYPVVILAGLGAGRNLADERKPLLLSNELGIGVDVTDGMLGYKHATFMNTAVKRSEHEKSTAEEIRLLYVAMTRAQDELYLFGSRSGERKRGISADGMQQNENDSVRLSRDEILTARSSLEWLEEVLDRSPQARKALIRREETVMVPQTAVCPPSTGKSVTSSAEEDVPSFSAEELEEKLSYRYPYTWLSRVPQLISVSELKEDRMKQALNDPASPQQDPDMISFVTEEKEKSSGPSSDTTASRRGTAFHEIVGAYPLSRLFTDSPDEIKKNMVSWHYLTPEDADLVPEEWIEKFQHSDMAAELQRSQSIHREEPFILQLPLSLIRQYTSEYPIADTPEAEKETMMVQGIIDCYYETAQGLVLADYKTDYLLGPAQIAGYTRQLEIYRRALESASGRKVVRMYLYDVRRSREIECHPQENPETLTAGKHEQQPGG